MTNRIHCYLFAALLLFCSVFVHAQNVRYDGVVSSRSGAPAAGAFVAVCGQPANSSVTPCSPVVPLCSSLSDVVCNQPNPLQADGLGNFHFYISGASLPVTLQWYGSTVTTYAAPDQYLGGFGGLGATGTGVPGQIVVSGGTIGLANPTIMPGAGQANGAFGESGASSGVYFNPDAACAWQGTSTFQDQFCDLTGYGPIWNGGIGQPPLGFLLVKIQLGGYTSGQFFSYNPTTGYFEPATNITALNGTLNAVSMGAANANFSNLTGTFSVDSAVSSFILGVTPVNPCCSLRGGSAWMLDPSLHSFGHIVYFDPESNYDVVLTNNDTACDFSGGCTGASTGGSFVVALQNSPSFKTPFLDNATGTSLSLSSTTGDNMDLQAGLVTPFVQATPAANHIKTGYGSDGTFKLSNGSAADNAFYSFTQTVAKGTATMTTAGIATGACGTTVTVAATGAATTDTIEVSRNAAATIGNGGGLTLNWWPTANNVNFNYCNSAAGTITPTAMTVNFRVTR